jgi:hypothetical protein
MPITLEIDENNELVKSYYLKNKNKKQCFTKNKIKKIIAHQLLLNKKRELVKQNGITLTFD